MQWLRISNLLNIKKNLVQKNVERFISQLTFYFLLTAHGYF